MGGALIMNRVRKIQWEDFQSGYRENNGRPVLTLHKLTEALEQSRTTRHVQRAIDFATNNPSTEYAQELANHPQCPQSVSDAVEDMYSMRVFLGHMRSEIAW